MKLAWLISGVYKNSTEPILRLEEWLRNQSEFDQIDIYMYIWWDKSYVGKRHSHLQFSVVEDDPTAEIMEKIKPKKLVLAEQEPIDLSGMPLQSGAGGTSRQRETAYFTHFSQMCGIRKCIELIEDPSEYDAILRMRGDLCMDQLGFKTSFTKEMFETNKIWIADGQFFTGWPFGDWAYIGGVHPMLLYITNVENLFKTLCLHYNKLLHTHDFLQIAFPVLGLTIERWYVPLKITRLCRDHSSHLLLDKENNDPNLDPFYWNMMDAKRLMT